MPAKRLEKNERALEQKAEREGERQSFAHWNEREREIKSNGKKKISERDKERERKRKRARGK